MTVSRLSNSTKLIFFIFLLAPAVVFSQWKSTVSDGNYTDPSIWNPPGAPTNGADININHDVVLNTNIIFNSGELYLGSGGTLTEDGNNRTIWCQSGGTLYMNGGTIDCHLLRISEGSATQLYASYFNVDTFWNEKDGVVCPVGINANYLLNDSSAWLICNGINNNVDSIVNLGKLEIGNITTTNTIYNEGELINHFSLVVTGDFYNCNGQGSIAELTNNLSICVEADFTNCSDGLINGNGDIFTAGNFLNDGNITDNQDILSPSGMISGSGNVDSTVFVGIGNCSSSIEENELEELSIFPNPASDQITVSANGVDFTLMNSLGQIVLKGKIENNRINLEEIPAGIYLLEVESFQTKRLIIN